MTREMNHVWSIVVETVNQIVAGCGRKVFDRNLIPEVCGSQGLFHLPNLLVDAQPDTPSLDLAVRMLYDGFDGMWVRSEVEDAQWFGLGRLYLDVTNLSWRSAQSGYLADVVLLFRAPALSLPV